MDAVQFNASVCNVVAMIPPRKVTSCGHIAKLLGEPTKARRVSEVVKFLGQTCSPLPWHRVISTSGIIPRRDGLGRIQTSALESEGIPVSTGAYGESRIDFEASGWFPERLSVIPETDPDEDWGA